MIATASLQSERFVLRLATATPASELEAWLADAGAPVRVEYASGMDLPRAEPGVLLVARWVAEGRVSTFQKRDSSDNRRWQFIVEKHNSSPHGASPSGNSLERAVPSPTGTSTRRSGRASPQPSGRCAVTTAREQAEVLMALLRRRAVAGGTCPTFAETVELLGLASGRRGTRRAAYLFDRLAGENRIAVAWAGPGQRRVVTIRAKGRGCGLSTAPGDQQ